MSTMVCNCIMFLFKRRLRTRSICNHTTIVAIHINWTIKLEHQT
jgi:hypothetical protein